MKNIRIFIIDDHVMVRSGLRLILEQTSDIQVVGEAGTGEEAIKTVPELNPDIILMDISLPRMDGVKTTEAIKKICPDTKIIALTMHAEDEYLSAFIKAGGVGYISKSAADRELLHTIKTALSGEFALQPQGIQILAKEYQENSKAFSSVEKLSAREYEVLVLTVKGFTSKEIGEQLFLSSRTVETYRQRIMSKLELKHRSELYDFAHKHKII